MKKNDIIVVCVVCAVITPFFFCKNVQASFSWLNTNHSYITSFIKFAVLATFGELLALRIIAGVYWQQGFGLIARMLVWGFLGILIKIAFGIFAAGTPHVLHSLGLPVDTEAFASGSFLIRLLTAFSISVAMNTIFAPVMMVLHKITDTHIVQNRGSLQSFFSIDCVAILQQLDWDVMWNFVFKKTIPFFWIPAHTITFLMPPEFRILFAAFLGIMLGLILAFAGKKKSENNCL